MFNVKTSSDMADETRLNETQLDEPTTIVNLRESVGFDETGKTVGHTEIDGPAVFLKGKEKNRFGIDYAENRNIAEGMMDLALLTANANQLRFLLTYNSQSSTFYISVGLVVLSLLLQVAVGIGLIFRRNTGRRSRKYKTNQLLVVGVFMITFVNVLVAALTTTDNKSSN